MSSMEPTALSKARKIRHLVQGDENLELVWLAT
jgi:hypothetical protein